MPDDERGDEDVGQIVDDVVERVAAEPRETGLDAEPPGECAVGRVNDDRQREPEERLSVTVLGDEIEREKREQRTGGRVEMNQPRAHNSPAHRPASSAQPEDSFSQRETEKQRRLAGATLRRR